MHQQLFLLHFAGGNCYSYDFIKGSLKDFNLFVLELPGRGRRLNENLLKDFDLAAHDIYRQLTQKLNSSPFFIYGHSMGAYLALRVSKMLEKSGTSPAYIIVSGNAGPGIGDGKKRYLMNHEDFVGELRKLGGVPDELIENQELFKYFDPILRADFEITEKNELGNEPAVNVPLYAIMGSREEKVDEISNWGRFTRSRFNYEVLEGDHFFIYKHPERIAGLIKECCSTVTFYQLY